MNFNIIGVLLGANTINIYTNDEKEHKLICSFICNDKILYSLKQSKKDFLIDVMGKYNYDSCINHLNTFEDEFYIIDEMERITNKKYTSDEVLFDLLQKLKIQYLKALKSDDENTISKLTDFESKGKIILSDIEEYLKIQDFVVPIRNSAKYRQNIGLMRQRLAKLLKLLGYIVRDQTDEYYLMCGNGYKHTTLNEVHQAINELIGDSLISRKDLSEDGAKGFITTTKPQYNIVMFNNCLFDMKELKVINPTDPIFSTVQINYNYNSEAQSVHFKNYLETSLKRETEEETQKAIKGLKQVVGYLFTNGNPLNALFIVTGVAGAGKSVFGEILTKIFGQDNTTDLKLQELTNTHSTASLLNKHLNIIKDSDQRIIENVGLVKAISGDEAILVNPKNKDTILIPSEEVPKTIITCNNVPRFATNEEALFERFVIIEFLNKIRGTDQQKENLKDILFDSDEEIEWFIYESIQAYKEMIENGGNFIFRISSDDTKAIVEKHQKPIEYLLQELIKGFDPIDFVKNNNEPIYYEDLNKVLLYLSKKEGLEIETNKNNKITPHKLTKSIKNAFELHGDVDHSTEILSSDFKEFKPNRKMIDGVRSVYYPYLIGNDKYWQILGELKQ